MSYYSVNRDDNDLRIVVCPSCSTPEEKQADVTVSDDVIPYKAEGHLLNLMKCNKCGAYFSFYEEDGLRNVTKAVAKKALERGDCDMEADGRDQHGHSYYVIFKHKPPTIPTVEYYALRWPKDDKEYNNNRFEKWLKGLPEVNDFIKYSEFYDNIDFARMQENYLKQQKNEWFH